MNRLIVFTQREHPVVFVGNQETDQLLEMISRTTRNFGFHAWIFDFSPDEGEHSVLDPNFPGTRLKEFWNIDPMRRNDVAVSLQDLKLYARTKLNEQDQQLALLKINELNELLLRTTPPLENQVSIDQSEKV